MSIGLPAISALRRISSIDRRRSGPQRFQQKPDKLETIEIDRHAPVRPAGLEIETGIGRRGPCDRGVAVADPLNDLDVKKTVGLTQRYLDLGGTPISRA